MDPSKLSKIKNAVKTHFEASPTSYVAFEEKYGFFQRLNSSLVAFMDIKDGSRILDIGCGTGTSSKQMLEHVPGSSVLGIDNSPSMLHSAQIGHKESSRLTFLEGDAAKLADLVSELFDAIVYSASIFLIPDFRESLRQANELLRQDGVLGVTFMDGVYDSHEQNLLVQADRAANEGISLKKPVKLDDLLSFFRELFANVHQKTEDFDLPREMLQEFYCVPAMSAGLFPGFSYPERRAKVEHLFSCMPGNGIFFRWVLIAGNKAPGETEES